MITIIDYSAGNLKSVENTFKALNIPTTIAKTPGDIQAATILVLPGVGAFGATMYELTRMGLVEPIKSHIAAKKPFLGICVGMQVLFESSEESPGAPGLGVFKGVVKKFSAQASGLKVPHMGWNQLNISADRGKFFNGVGETPEVYFVHSFYVDEANPSIVSTTTDYGVSFVSAVQTPTVFATQFHLEKSGEVGLKVLGNFCKIF